MKRSGIFILALFLGCLHTACDKEDPIGVDIPDPAFLQGLIDLGVDLDGDGLISEEEAGRPDSLVFPPLGIEDITGIRAFTNLKHLSLSLNPLGEIDLSGIGQLESLHLESCQLINLDISVLPGLLELRCGRNYISGLDLSDNQMLIRLSCNNNLLEQLDLSANTSLEKMISCGNRLSRLDISQNTRLKTLGIDNMPMLTDVCVWTLPFPPEGVTVLMGYSPNVVFGTDCSY